jgi:hypothetical protein
VNIYLLIADTITACKNEEDTSIENVIESLALAFKDNDPNFDYVQFFKDCELAEGISE